MAVVGVSPWEDARSLGLNTLRALLEGGYRGEVFAVHPRHREVLGVRLHRSLEELGRPVDLVISAVNREASLEVVRSARRLGAGGVVIYAAGFREVGRGELEERLRAAAGPMPVLGPNTSGFVNVPLGLEATFDPFCQESGGIRPGGVSILSQSGGIGVTLGRRAAGLGLGLNKLICLGNRTLVDFPEALDYLAQDRGTRVVGCFLEGLEDGRAFLQAARRLGKPLVAYKVGWGERLNPFGRSHTGALIGSQRVYQGAFRQFGIRLARSLDELLVGCKALDLCDPAPGRRAYLLTHSAGPSLVAAELLLARGAELPPTPEPLRERVRGLLRPNIPLYLDNPLDLTALGYSSRAYREIAQWLLADPGVDLLVAIYSHPHRYPSPAHGLAQVQRGGKPMVVASLACREVLAEDRRLLEEVGIPVFQSPEEAALAASFLIPPASPAGPPGGRTRRDRTPPPPGARRDA